MGLLEDIDDIIYEKKIGYINVIDKIDKDKIDIFYKKYIKKKNKKDIKKLKIKSLYEDLLKDEISRYNIIDKEILKNKKLKEIIFIDGRNFNKGNLIDVNKFDNSEYIIIYFGNELQMNDIKYYYQYDWFYLILIDDVNKYDTYISFYSGYLDNIYYNRDIKFKYITESKAIDEIKRTLIFWSGRECNLTDIYEFME